MDFNSTFLMFFKFVTVKKNSPILVFPLDDEKYDWVVEKPLDKVSNMSLNHGFNV